MTDETQSNQSAAADKGPAAGGKALVRRIAIVGDMHGQWNAADTNYFNQQQADLVLFAGDLGSGARKNTIQLARSIAKLRVPALIMPGNNDADHLAHLGAELAHQSGKTQLFRLLGQSHRAFVTVAGFGRHELLAPWGPLTLISGRPCAMGGSELSFPEQLARTHGIHSLEESTQRLQQLVDEAESDDLIFLGHNGPFGLGEEQHHLWGRDFSFPDERDARAPRDWGDQDLAVAVSYAQQQGKRVLSVIGGHMHRNKHNGRGLCETREGCLYLNPALVPRIVVNEEGEQHHFVELLLEENATVSAKDCFFEV